MFFLRLMHVENVKNIDAVNVFPCDFLTMTDVNVNANYCEKQIAYIESNNSLWNMIPSIVTLVSLTINFVSCNWLQFLSGFLLIFCHQWSRYEFRH